MLTILTQSVGYSLTPLSSKAPARMRTAVMSFDQEAFIAESKEMRLKHLEETFTVVFKIPRQFTKSVPIIDGDFIVRHRLGELFMFYIKLFTQFFKTRGKKAETIAECNHAVLVTDNHLYVYVFTFLFHTIGNVETLVLQKTLAKHKIHIIPTAVMSVKSMVVKPIPIIVEKI